MRKVWEAAYTYYYTEYKNQARKWAQWCEIGTSKKPFVKANQDKVVSPLTQIVLLGLLLQTHEFDFRKLLKFCLIIDGNYNDSSNTGWSIKVHLYNGSIVSENVMKNFNI